ncbi:hypothetical protein Ccar_19465 [Clostridium carboxidivorans P7]|uniref:Uncharacterized protein n=1 Tax=Clostridium carboxidivorans P7 TaxID=536227 RepID=C6Q1V4_9CLOT|nr:hypothetical protein [Clostridium carboxidivorans]AKN32906.1 hypothetical protein Ccar_19465 [Clostridium carboxidivorans P7]EET84530.1 conserved hypothetical protein [Clostridium carboxidivorans P7]EFG89839.1 hypothetical protein CLCAR_0032 [Clostridium carboxidivorans P7]
MLMKEPTSEMVEEWKAIYVKYKAKLYPNKKTALEIIEYLKQKYTLTEQAKEELKRVVVDNVIINKCYSNKLPNSKMPVAKVFYVENMGLGKRLYEKQDDVFKENKIIVGVELETAFFMVEGSSMLWDELFAFRGLDEGDLNNFYLVAEYITCLKKFDMLDSVLAQAK